MKNFILSLVLTLITCVAFAQSKHALPMNDLGLITYSKVVQVPDASKETLINSAFNYLELLVDNHKNIRKKPSLNKDSTEIYLPLAYTAYRDFPVHSPHGIIKYQLTVTVKDGRYRYVATNFVFHYLERNRYGKFVEAKGRSKSMEEPFFKGNQKLWDQHKYKTGEKVAGVIEELYAEMLLLTQGPKEDMVTIEDIW